jgi:hypothetical protein
MNILVRLGRLEQEVNGAPPPDEPLPPFEELRKLPLEELVRLYRRLVAAPITPAHRAAVEEECQRLRKLPPAELLAIYRREIGEPRGLS